MARGMRWTAAAILIAVAAAVWVLGLRAVGWSFQGVLGLAPILAVLSGLVLLPLVLLLPGRALRLTAGAVSLVLLLPLLPLAHAVAFPGHVATGDLRVLTWNMQDHPAAVATLEDIVASRQPDVVVLEQTPYEAVWASSALTHAYPYRLVDDPETMSTSVAILSRFPLGEHEVLAGEDWPNPRVVVTTVAAPTGMLTVFGGHPPYPLTEEGRGYGGWRDPQLAGLADAVEQAQSSGAARVLVVGDLNVTTREHAYRALRSDTGLDDAADWPWWSAMGTWRRTDRAIPAFLPLDHVLHSPCLTSIGSELLWRSGGSDHIPVVATFDDRCG